MKNSYLRLLPVLVLSLVSCGKYSEIKVGVFETAIKNCNNEGKTPRITNSGDTIKADAYSIGFFFKAHIVSKDDRKDVQGENTYYIYNHPKSYYVISLDNFDSSRHVGDTLNDYFFRLNDTLAYNLDSPGYYFAEKWDYKNSTSMADTFYSYSYLLLMKQPTNSGLYRFAIHIESFDTTSQDDTLNALLK